MYMYMPDRPVSQVPSDGMVHCTVYVIIHVYKIYECNIASLGIQRTVQGDESVITVDQEEDSS